MIRRLDAVEASLREVTYLPSDIVQIVNRDIEDTANHIPEAKVIELANQLDSRVPKSEGGVPLISWVLFGKIEYSWLESTGELAKRAAIHSAKRDEDSALAAARALVKAEDAREKAAADVREQADERAKRLSNAKALVAKASPKTE